MRLCTIDRRIEYWQTTEAINTQFNDTTTSTTSWYIRPDPSARGLLVATTRPKLQVGKFVRANGHQQRMSQQPHHTNSSASRSRSRVEGEKNLRLSAYKRREQRSERLTRMSLERSISARPNVLLIPSHNVNTTTHSTIIPFLQGNETAVHMSNDVLTIWTDARQPTQTNTDTVYI